MASTDARPVPRKNVAFRVYFPILDADGDPVTGAAGLDSEVSKDGAAFADCTNEATEIGTSGIYYLDLTSTEMNADSVVVRVQTSTSGAKTTPIIMYPEELGDFRVDPQTIWDALTSALTTAGSIGKLLVDNINATISSRSTLTAAGVWDALLSGIATATSIGKLIKDNLDATISSRSSHSAADVWAAATRTLSATGVQAIWDAAVANLTTAGSIGKRLVDNIDAVLSTRFNAVDAALVAIDDFVDTEMASANTDLGTLLSRLSALRAGYLDNLSAGAVALQTSVDDLEGRLTAALATTLLAHHLAVLRVVVGAASTTTALKLSTVNGGAPSGTDDFYNGRTIVFTSGALAGQAVAITDYVGATTTATISASTSAASNADTAVIV